MSNVLELPDDVMREVERQAAHAGSDPREFAAQCLRNALRDTARPAMGVGRLETDSRTGLPVFRGSPDAPARGMTIEQLLALEQDCLLSEDLQRAGFPH